jgi:flagellar basal-body rod protein FlgB
MRFLFGKTIDLLSTMLDFRAERHKVIVSNIANIDTPDYKPQNLVFNIRLEEAKRALNGMDLTKTSNRHLSPALGSKGQFQVAPSGNKVEIDKEMANLAENNLMYNLTVELLSRKFKSIDTALREIK